jgi:hypothetical protein
MHSITICYVTSEIDQIRIKIILQKSENRVIYGKLKLQEK